MRQRRASAERLRNAEFEAFTAGAAGRLLHAATLLTGDPKAADRLLTAALAHTYADWYRMRGEDPYAYTRNDLVRRFAHRPWWQRPQGGLLERLTAQERLMIVLRLYEGIAEEQVAAQLGLPTDRVRSVCLRAMATLRSRPPATRSYARGGTAAEAPQPAVRGVLAAPAARGVPSPAAAQAQPAQDATQPRQPQKAPQVTQATP